MGLDLRLLPFDADFFSHTILDCGRRSVLFEALLRVERKSGRDVPDNFQSFSGKSGDVSPCYGRTIRTPYGDNLRYVLATDLLKFTDHVGVTDNEKNRAIWAYLSHLNPNTKVALYWH